MPYYISKGLVWTLVFYIWSLTKSFFDQSDIAQIYIDFFYTCLWYLFWYI